MSAGAARRGQHPELLDEELSALRDLIAAGEKHAIHLKRTLVAPSRRRDDVDMAHFYLQLARRWAVRARKPDGER